MTAPFWGRGVLGPKCAHVRETLDGRPLAENVDGELVGFALCGCLVIADIDPDADRVTRCSACAELLGSDPDGSA
jgi:hypothetical protein